MIKLVNILLEQPQDVDKLNVLFITDYPTETIGNFAKRLIATDKVTGEIKSYSKQDSSEAVSLVAHNISTEFDLIIVQVSGIRDRSAKDLLNNLNRIVTITERKKIPVVFIAPPTTRFANSRRDLDFIDQAYNIISQKTNVIELPEIADDSYFSANGIILNKAGNQIVYDKILTYLKTLDSSIEITPEDSEEIEGDEPVTRTITQRVTDKVKDMAKTAGTAVSKAEPGTWQQVMKFLIDKGLTKEGAAGVAGNMKIESDFNPGAIGDNGTSYGICQWHATRKTALIKFAKAQGKSVNDMNVQLEYLWQELTSSYSALVKLLKTTTDPRDAAYQFAAKFERPANISNKRLDYAQQYSESYGSEDGMSVVDAIKTGISLVSLAGKSNTNKSSGKNGNLPSGELTSVGEGNHKLAHPAATAYIKMKAAALKDGVTLKIGDSYRPLSVQNSIFDWDLYNSTGKKAKKGTNGSTAAAYPGTSNHGLGRAIDVPNKSAQDWIRANGMNYGWSWDEGRSVGEPWHFTYVK